MNIHTIQGVADAIERLAQRDSRTLATFIVSFAQDFGPIAEQVRTFIVADDVAETVESVRKRITTLRIPTEGAHRHARGQEIGTSLQYILDAIETMVLPIDPKRAFDLLVLFFQSDGQAMENCGDHDFEVSCAFQRAAKLFGQASQSLPRAKVAAALEPLIDDDGYGVRGALAEVMSSRDATP